MLKKILVLTLVAVLVSLGCVSSAPAQEKETVTQVEPTPALSKKEIKRAQKVRKAIKSLGVGKSAQTGVSLIDKTEFKGYVSEATDEYFIITDEKTGADTRIEYAKVEKFKMWPTVNTLMRRDFSSPARIFKKVAIATIVVVGVAVAACAISNRCQE